MMNPLFSGDPRRLGVGEAYKAFERDLEIENLGLKPLTLDALMQDLILAVIKTARIPQFMPPAGPVVKILIQGAVKPAEAFNLV